jgi:cation:H+ antiporter
VHPVSLAILVTYVFGMRLVAASGNRPMWQARWTQETNEDRSRSAGRSGSIALVWLRFSAVGVVLVGSGVLLAETGIEISRISGLSESFVGALLTGFTSSMPELVTALTAVRIGALSLAISNIIGGNAFDTTIVALSDLVYPGSIYQVAGEGFAVLLGATLLMNTVVLLGLIRRERHGIANIGLEGILLLLMYGGVVIWLAG